MFLLPLAVMALLAWLDRLAIVHRFILAGIIALVVTRAIWWVVPTLGPSAMFAIDPVTAEAASLVVDGAYGAELRRLAEEGSVVVSPHGVLGVISFPSYHIVMALLTAWFARGTWVAAPAAVLGLAMVPATLVHGGHYAVDLVGGLMAFAAALALATRLIPARP